MATPEELASDIGERWSIFRDARDIVDTKFDEGRAYAADAFRVAQETIQRLSDLAGALNLIDVNVGALTDDISPINLDDFVATTPVAPVIDLNMPADLGDADGVDQAIHDKLIHDITEGGPAIPEAVETAIFNRERERSLLVHQDTLDSISAEWSKRGFTLPNGMLNGVLSQAIIDYNNKRQDVSRDISIKSFELGDANTKFAIEKGIQWVANRIESFKARIQAEISRIDAIIKSYMGQVEVFKGSASVYSTVADVHIKKFDAELKVALAKAQLTIEGAQVEMKNYELLNQLKIEAMKGIASVAAQLGAGALSSVSAGAHISASNAASYAYSPTQAPSIND